jgi:hypothetical protein
VAAQLAFGRPNAIDQHSSKAHVPVDGTIPLTKPMCWFPTPRHGASSTLGFARQMLLNIGRGTGPSHCQSGMLISRRATHALECHPASGRYADLCRCSFSLLLEFDC